MNFKLNNFRVDKTGIEYYVGWVALEGYDLEDFKKALKCLEKIRKKEKEVKNGRRKKFKGINGRSSSKPITAYRTEKD
jgi:hypothetical protein